MKLMMLHILVQRETTLIELIGKGEHTVPLTRSYGFVHAERGHFATLVLKVSALLMDQRQSGGWQLPKESNLVMAKLVL